MKTKLKLRLSLCSLSMLFAMMVFYMSAIWAYSNQQLSASVNVEYEAVISFDITTASNWKLTNLRQFNNSSTSTTLGSVSANSSNKFTVTPITVGAGNKLVYEIMITPSINKDVTITFTDNGGRFSSAALYYNGNASVRSPCSQTSWGTLQTATGRTYTVTLRNKKNNYFYLVINNTSSSSLGYVAEWVIS